MGLGAYDPDMNEIIGELKPFDDFKLPPLGGEAIRDFLHERTLLRPEADPDLCTACGTCEIMCPIGAIELYEEIPLVCDLCGGDPRCVKACTLDAIHYESDVTAAVSLKEFKKGSRGLDPEEKRLRYVLSCAEQLRQNWIAERRG